MAITRGGRPRRGVEWGCGAVAASPQHGRRRERRGSSWRLLLLLLLQSRVEAHRVMISRVGARRPVGARALPEHAVAREEAPAVQIRVRPGQLAQAVRRRTLGRARREGALSKWQVVMYKSRQRRAREDGTGHGERTAPRGGDNSRPLTRVVAHLGDVGGAGVALEALREARVPIWEALQLATYFALLAIRPGWPRIAIVVHVLLGEREHQQAQHRQQSAEWGREVHRQLPVGLVRPDLAVVLLLGSRCHQCDVCLRTRVTIVRHSSFWSVLVRGRWCVCARGLTHTHARRRDEHLARSGTFAMSCLLTSGLPNVWSPSLVLQDTSCSAESRRGLS